MQDEHESRWTMGTEKENADFLFPYQVPLLSQEKLWAREGSEIVDIQKPENKRTEVKIANNAYVCLFNVFQVSYPQHWNLA